MSNANASVDVVTPTPQSPVRRAAAGKDAPIKVGNSMPLINIPVGTTVHCIEMRPGKGAQLARSAGAGAQLV